MVDVRGVIEAENADVLGDPEALLPQGIDDADGDLAVGHEQGGVRHAVFDQLPGDLTASLQGALAKVDLIAVFVPGETLHGVLEALDAVHLGGGAL